MSRENESVGEHALVGGVTHLGGLHPSEDMRSLRVLQSPKEANFSQTRCSLNVIHLYDALHSSKAPFLGEVAFVAGVQFFGWAPYSGGALLLRLLPSMSLRRVYEGVESCAVRVKISVEDSR
jgi:hypothetical protein